MSKLQTQSYLCDIKTCSVEDVASVASLLFIRITCQNAHKNYGAFVPRSQWTMRNTRQLILVVVAVVALNTGHCVEAKTTQKPKYQYTKKPVPQVTVQNPLTTSKTHKLVPTAKSVQPPPPPATEKPMYASHSFQNDHPLSTEAPGGGPENYTLDYNECYFNFCECCPPERGPRGPKGDRGLEGMTQPNNPCWYKCCWPIRSVRLYQYMLLCVQGHRGREGLVGLLDYQDRPEWADPLG